MREAVVSVDAETVEFEAAAAFAEFFFIGDEHSAFAGSDVLDGVEREHCGSGGADEFAFVAGPERVRGVFHKTDSVFFRNGAERIEIGAGAGEVDGDDQFCARSDVRLHLFGIDHQGVPVDVHEDRFRAREDGEIDHGDPGHGGSYDLVAGPDPERVEEDFHHAGFGSHGDGVVRPEISFEIGFKLCDFGAGGDPAGAQNIRDSLNVGFFQIGFGKGKERISHDKKLLVNIPDLFPG